MLYILAVSVSAKYSNTEERLFTAFATVCILYPVFMHSAVRTVRPFLFILWVCGQRLYLLISSQQGEWISEISLLPHGKERSEPQDFELCSCFVLSLGNSLYSILILKPWAHALDLRTFYSVLNWKNEDIINIQYFFKQILTLMKDRRLRGSSEWSQVRVRSDGVCFNSLKFKHLCWILI